MSDEEQWGERRPDGDAPSDPGAPESDVWWTSTPSTPQASPLQPYATTPEESSAPPMETPPPPAASPPSPWWAAPGESWARPGAYAAPVKAASRGVGLPALLALLTAVALLSGLVSAGVAVWATRDAPSVSRPVLGSPTSGDAAPQDITDRPVSTVAGIAGRVLPSVVSVEVRTSDGGGTGSGFVIDDTGYVLTNNHVVEPAADADGVIKIVLADERRVDARIVGRASTYDLAVLKVTKTDGLVPARLGDSDAVAVGDPVVAIGSPLGLAGTVTSGIISATERPVSARRPREGEEGASNDSYISALQTDAAINPGNSGGPLVDGSGKVVGVNTAIATLGGLGGQTGSIGLGFAIPINQARRTAQQLIETGEASFPVIGASVGGEVAGRGAQIADGADALVAGGPAERAGLRPGDVIVAIDGDRVNSSEELIVEIRSRLPGDRVTLTYERGGQQRQAQVTLGASQE